MNYLTEYYRNKSIVLEQRVKELQDILVLVENNKNYYLEENWREYLAKLVGGAADDVAAAAGKKFNWSTKLHPNRWRDLVKEDLLKFAGPPLTWTRPGPGGTAKQYILKRIPIKDGEVYEVWQWDEAGGQWLRGRNGPTPWGNVGPSGYVPVPGRGLVPGPDGKWFNPNANASAVVGDAGPVRATVAGNETQGAGGSDEEITI